MFSCNLSSSIIFTLPFLVNLTLVGEYLCPVAVSVVLILVVVTLFHFAVRKCLKTHIALRVKLALNGRRWSGFLGSSDRWCSINCSIGL